MQRNTTAARAVGQHGNVHGAHVGVEERLGHRLDDASRKIDPRQHIHAPLRPLRPAEDRVGHSLSVELASMTHAWCVRAPHLLCQRHERHAAPRKLGCHVQTLVLAAHFKISLETPPLAADLRAARSPGKRFLRLAGATMSCTVMVSRAQRADSSGSIV